jgi:hypothetical protein
MCKFVEANTPEPGYINYEQMVKYLAQCIGRLNTYDNSQQQVYQQSPRQNQQTSRYQDQSDQFDPDEQAIIRLMHENTKDWDKSSSIDCDGLRKQFYELDYNKRYIFSQRQVINISGKVLVLMGLFFLCIED